MHDAILRLASAFVQPSDDELPLLDALCCAAAAQWQRQLAPPLSPNDCGDAFPCAAAMSAAAAFLPAHASSGSFSIGDLSLQPGADAPKASQLLLSHANALMAPFISDDHFAFLGVRS